jgi:DNA-binding MarR family transcriptional regulator
MTRDEKLDYIFETGKRFRFYMEDLVVSGALGPNTLCDELSTIQLNAAMNVWYHQPMSLTELAKKMGVTPPSASVMVDRLVEKKVLTRVPHPSDRRKIQIAIHPDSEKGMDEVHRYFQKAFDRIARRVGDENVERWYQVMLQVRSALQEEMPEHASA